MADVTVARGQWCPELNLEPGKVTTVSFTDQALTRVEVVVVEAAGRVRWTADGSDPSENAGWFVPVDGVDERTIPSVVDNGTRRSTVIKLWCSGTAKACVQRL